MARLSVIGARAVVPSSSRHIPQTGDRRAHAAHPANSRSHRRLPAPRPLAQQAIAAGGDIGIAAAGVLRALLTSRHPEPRTTSLSIR